LPFQYLIKENNPQAQGFINMKSKIDLQRQNTNNPLYVGWIGRDNLGDEALMEAFCELFPSMKPFPNTSTFLTRIALLAGKLGWKQLKPAFQNRHIKSVLHRFPQSDVFLGGGTLIGSKQCLPLLQQSIKEKRNVYTFGCGVMDMQFWAGHNDYPVDPAEYLQKWKDVLQKCRNVSVRGFQSQRLLQSLGISCEVTGDPAIHFACKDNVALPKKKILGINWGFAHKILWGNDEMTVGQVLRDAVNRLISQGWDIKVFSIFIKDTTYCRDWIDSLDQPAHAELCVEYKNPRRFIKLVQQCDVFVGMKLHATILAFIAQVPSIMLEYRPKCADFMETMGALSRNIRCDRLDSTDLIALIEQTFSNQEIIRKEQKEVSNHYANISLKYFKRIQAEMGYDCLI